MKEEGQRRLNVVVATAEPRGAYHLEPLHETIRRRVSLRLTHIVPYEEQMQGQPWDETTSDMEALRQADRVVITGGRISAWTELVWRYAHSIGKDVTYTELAFLSETVPTYSGVRWPPMGNASAINEASGLIVSRMFPGTPVTITGAPLLQGAAEESQSDPTSRKVLFLSRVGREKDDAEDQARKLMTKLRSEGFEPIVRHHPREDPGAWAPWQTDRSPSAAHAAAGTYAVCGYPGTALSLLAALGHPAVALETSDRLARMLPEHQRDVVGARARRAEEAYKALMERRTASAQAREKVVGPAGDAAGRIVDLWDRRL